MQRTTAGLSAISACNCVTTAVPFNGSRRVSRTVIKVHTDGISVCFLVSFGHLGGRILIIGISVVYHIAYSVPWLVHGEIPPHIVHLGIINSEVGCVLEERHVAIEDSRRLGWMVWCAT